MKIAGIHATHDGAVALINDGVLTSCIEQEKVFNFPRYSKLPDPMETIMEAEMNGYEISMDGVNKKIALGKTGLEFHTHLPHAGYHGTSFIGDRITSAGYHSYGHILNHITSSHCSSKAGYNDSVVFIMDGGVPLQAYLVQPHRYPFAVNKLGEIDIPFLGFLYGVMGRHFGPYVDRESGLMGARDFPGKLMGYIAKGNDAKAHDVFRKILQFENTVKGDFQCMNHPYFRGVGQVENDFCEKVKRWCNEMAVSDATILLGMHIWMEHKVVEFVNQIFDKYSDGTLGLVRHFSMVGGTFLNIKFNSAIRRNIEIRSPQAEVWVPPFPNDSGSAIGAACSHMIFSHGKWDLEWNVYCGPKIEKNYNYDVGKIKPVSMTPFELGKKLVAEGLVGIFAAGRAELGPRALGARSIIAPATSLEYRDRLNKIKGREDWRPVAPIVMDTVAAQLGFDDLAQKDKYMLFDHISPTIMRKTYPAAVHLDGTCRLQVVDHIEEHLPIHSLLMGANQMLCNTSANKSGCGFFYDVKSMIEFGIQHKLDYVYADGEYYDTTGAPS